MTVLAQSLSRALDNVTSVIGRFLDVAGDLVKERPWVAVVIAIVVGVFIITRRR